MMNFSQAVKGQLTHPAAILAIQSQAETELGRSLTKEEESYLLSKNTPHILLGQMQKYGFGFLKFQLFLSQSPQMSFEASPNPTPRDGNCLIHAITDSIINNDALKHNGKDGLNETWCKLLQDLQFYDEVEDHNMLLRTRWALGAAEWLSGENGSKQNDKEILGYSDEEWDFIWTTMLEDKAWAVPGLKDNLGNIVKSNEAPEMFIKYIAHDIKCHIIIFDLMLGQVQFCSANHLQDNNASFDSPILLYCTGGHFQSVFQKDHEYCISFSQELEVRNNEVPPATSLVDQHSKSNPMGNNSFTPDKKSNKTEKTLINLTKPNPMNEELNNFELPRKSPKFMKRKILSPTLGPVIDTFNLYECLSSEDDPDKRSTINETKKKKVDPMTREKFSKQILSSSAALKEKEKARKQLERSAVSEQEKEKIRAKDRARKKKAKEAQSFEVTDRNRVSNNEAQRKVRNSQSAEEKEIKKQINNEAKKKAKNLSL